MPPTRRDVRADRRHIDRSGDCVAGYHRRLLKHGIFTGEDDLAEQMLAFVETYYQTAKPFKWTYAGKVLEA